MVAVYEAVPNVFVLTKYFYLQSKTAVVPDSFFIHWHQHQQCSRMEMKLLF